MSPPSSNGGAYLIVVALGRTRRQITANSGMGGLAMVEQQAAILSPEALIEEFQKNGVTHVVCIPDSETNYLYELMKEQPSLEIVPASTSASPRE